MGFFSDLIKQGKNASSSLGKMKDQWVNGATKDGLLAATALMTAADGKIEPDEVSKVAGMIAKNEAFASFDASDLKTTFTDFCKKATDDWDKLELIKKVGKLKSDPVLADYAMKAVLIVAHSDGDFADVEKKVAREIAATLGLDAEAYL